MTVLIKSHTYTINLSNVLSIREHIGRNGHVFTRFVMNSDQAGYVVQITCPYHIVMKQIAKCHWTRNGDLTGTVRIIELDY